MGPDVGGIELRDAADNLIFASHRPQQAVLQVLTGQIVTSAHAPDGFYAAGHIADHPIGSTSLSVSRVMGWIKMNTATGIIPGGDEFEFSGSATIEGLERVLSDRAETAILLTLSPLISGGNVYIREEWWNNANAGPGFPNVTIPALTVDYDVRLYTMIGGS
ncbi:hypothetical protein [Parvibaculum sp.]|uniref:hypothetical protein n=1 Tax=Parvibaculum sp. TaxID=2024848 RepID=UPI001D4018DA|nr:hypothetical protein [Parvibaculum sp.]MBX3488855.1 hypothetical protein [Parvibaculum sp.]